LGVISNFGSIAMEFGMEVEIDTLNDYPKFGSDSLISCLGGEVYKKIQLTLFPCSIDNG